MSGKIKGSLGAMLAMAMAMEAMSAPVDLRNDYQKPSKPDNRKGVQVEVKPPAGTKEYFFNAEGEFHNKHMRKDECVFKCFAINDKNAIRKFEKFKLNNREK